MKWAAAVIFNSIGRCVRGSIASSYQPGKRGSKKLTSRARRPPTRVHPSARASTQRGPHWEPGSSSGGTCGERTNGRLRSESHREAPTTTAREPAEVRYVRRSGATLRHVVAILLRGLEARRSWRTRLRSEA